MAQATELDSAPGTTIEIDRVRFQIRATGSGRPLVIFGGQTQAGALIGGLAAHHRVLAIEIANDEPLGARQLAETAANALARLKLDGVSVIGISRGAELALALALVAPNQIDKLILLAPPRLAALDEAVLAELIQVKAATLVMVGSNDRSGAVETMRALREKIPACQILLIYGAGEAIVSDRPDACISPITEFLARGIEFVVCHESQLLRR